MPIIKILAELYVETEDPDAACNTLDMGADSALRDAPGMDVLEFQVDRFEVLSPEEIADRGFEEA